MKKYVIEWTEILHKNRIIMAESLEDALKEAKRLYNTCVVLYPDNYTSTIISAIDVDTGERKFTNGKEK